MTESERLSIHDLKGLPNDDGHRYELIDGALHVSAQPHLAHQIIVDTLCGMLRAWNRQSGIGGIAVSAAHIIFDEHEAMVPDLVWFGRERLLAARHPDGMLHGPPDLVVEVLAPGLKYETRDRRVKPARYARWGVRSYWLVERFGRKVEVYRLEASSYRHSATFGEGDTLTASILPGFVCPLSELFADLAH